MSDSHVTFRADGTHFRGEDVQALDVESTPQGSTKAEEEAGPVQPKAAAAATSKPATLSKPGTFSLSSLKSSVAKSAPTSPPIPEPPKEEPKSESAPEPVPESESTPELEPVPENDGSPSVGDVLTPRMEAAASEPAVQEESAALVEQEAAVAEEPPKSVPKPTFNLSQLTPNKSIDTSEMDKKVDVSQRSELPVLAAEELATVEPAEEPVPGLPVEVPVESEPASVEEPAPVGEQAGEPKDEQAKGSTALAENVQAMHLESMAAATPREADAPKLGDQNLQSRVDETGVETFNILPLDKFLEIVGSTRAEISQWAVKCVAQASRAPAAIFCSSVNPHIRFYNFYPVSRGIAGVIVGSQDAITCMKIGLKSGTVEDNYIGIHTEGIAVLNMQGDTVALFTERLRKAVKV